MANTMSRRQNRQGVDHCTFINEGCPDDFCTLRWRHKGGHLLQTMPYDLPENERVPRRRGDCAPRGTPKNELVDLAIEGRARA